MEQNKKQNKNTFQTNNDQTAIKVDLNRSARNTPTVTTNLDFT